MNNYSSQQHREIQSENPEDILNTLRNIKEKTYGYPSPVQIVPADTSKPLTATQTELLKNIITYLDEITTNLSTLDQDTLANTAKNLIVQINYNFIIE